MLIVQDTDWIRRNPIQHTHLAERLVLRGHKVRVIDYEILWRTEGKKELFSSRQVFHISRILKDALVTVIRPGILKIPVLDYISMLVTYRREIRRQIREFKPDVIISNDILSTYLSYQAARKENIPTVYYIIDVEYGLVPFRFLQPIGKVIEGKNIKNADLVVAINEGLREYAVRMGARPERTLVLKAGIDPEQYNPGMDGGQVREEYGIGREDTVLLFMGWLYHFSGLKEVATELSRMENGHIKLLIVGDGDAFSNLQMMVTELGVYDRVILTGRQPYPRMPEFIASADVCLLPSHTNDVMRSNVPIKMYEYMAMEKPVISTRLPGVAQEFGKNNGVVYVDDPEGVITKAMELIDKGRLKETGRKARAFVARYSWDNITDQFEKILEEAVRKKQNEQVSKRV